MELAVQQNVPLAPLTTFKVGGNASQYIKVATEEELTKAVRFAKAHGLRCVVLGGGSNVLVADEGINALVIHIVLRGIETVALSDNKVSIIAKAGEDLDTVVAYAVAHNWWGMENLSHIPGTVGAVPVQNVGAYGIEAKDIIAEVRVFNTHTETFEELGVEACQFGYRDSVFKHEAGAHFIVTSVTFTLSTIPTPRIEYRDLALLFRDTVPSLQEIREAVMKIRAGKFPNWHITGTAGSFFKNPIIPHDRYITLQGRYPELPGFPLENGDIKIPLGWILDKVLQVRGYTQGNVATYEHQALVIVAHTGATSSEIETFAHEIAVRVLDATGIDIEWEVTKIS